MLLEKKERHFYCLSLKPQKLNFLSPEIYSPSLSLSTIEMSQIPAKTKDILEIQRKSL